MGAVIRGKAFTLGDDINTDYIIPGKYVDVYEPAELATHAFEGLGPDYPTKLRGHTVVVGGENFGMGSAREQAPNALKGAGVQAVVAKSFARIFYRNTLNVGVAAIECPEAAAAIQPEDEVEIDLDQAVILVGGKQFPFPPLSQQVRVLIEAGGMLPYLRHELGLRD
jgi:3-isopropylmalate/(R)-2-methylmalate dehydratase small subunit